MFFFASQSLYNVTDYTYADWLAFNNLVMLFKEIVGAVVIFDHGLKFGIIFLVSDHPAHIKLIASKKQFLLSNNQF
jgi:hypothetical protein